ncbi:hypothetical protein FFLO_00398 [Filobasidium floriforme]|uniref:Uncharacterized protein n=1 Tax=Filobasidium floriforme TaxID=5210 RepID=A0A8K0JSI4_9TREE|nr:uncharacterized protein HD553DRAFT_321621 [Filobasidium floriforme]KAG7575408.1 hypothetical protein FFLO_00398 [Filobasidium floriforme]KAH8089499.1 hypothetical protein HD553DRAFT_321621 [Filobasidium floriforme]
MFVWMYNDPAPRQKLQSNAYPDIFPYSPASPLSEPTVPKQPIERSKQKRPHQPLGASDSFRFDRALANEMTTIRKPCYHSQISPRAQGFRCARTQGRMSSEASRRIWVCVSPDSKSYSRSPGDRGNAFASLPFVRSGAVTRKSGGQTVRRLRGSVSNEALFPGEKWQGFIDGGRGVLYPTETRYCGELKHQHHMSDTARAQLIQNRRRRSMRSQIDRPPPPQDGKRKGDRPGPLSLSSKNWISALSQSPCCDQQAFRKSLPGPLTRRDGDQARSIVLASNAGAKGKGSDSYCTRDGERRTIYLDRNPIAYNLAPSLYVQNSRFTYRAREVARQKRLSDLHLKRSDSPACEQGGSTS